MSLMVALLTAGCSSSSATDAGAPPDSGCFGDPVSACGGYAQAGILCRANWSDALAASCGPTNSGLGDCPGYHVAQQAYGDTGRVSYYALDGGALVAVVHGGSPSISCAGPSDFTWPSWDSCHLTPVPVCPADGG